MKKTILKAAVATALIVPTMVMAEATLYGNVHLSINAADNDVANADNDISMSSNTSAIGVKGSEDLGDGMKALYKVEFQVGLLGGADTTPDSGPGSATGDGALKGRDQWVGLKGGMGTIKFGTMSSNYKQMGGKVDPLYRTPLEGRGFLGMQSNLHNGRDINRGRMTNAVQYSSPKMGGMQLVANTTFSGSEDETMGLGLRYATKNVLVYLDWIDSQTGDFSALTFPVTSSPSAAAIHDCDANPGCETEAATKIGAKYSADAFSVALQYEDAEDRTGYNYIFAAGTFNIDKNNMIALTYGDAAGIDKLVAEDYNSVAVAYNHKLSKMTNVYAGYGAKSSDLDKNDESMFTVGIKKKF